MLSRLTLGVFLFFSALTAASSSADPIRVLVAETTDTSTNRRVELAGKYVPQLRQTIASTGLFELVSEGPTLLAAKTCAGFRTYDVVYIPITYGNEHREALRSNSAFRECFASDGRAVVTGYHAEEHPDQAAGQFLFDALSWIDKGDTTGLLVLNDLRPKPAKYDFLQALFPGVGSSVRTEVTSYDQITFLTTPPHDIHLQTSDGLQNVGLPSMDNWHQTCHTAWDTLGAGGGGFEDDGFAAVSTGETTATDRYVCAIVRDPAGSGEVDCPVASPEGPTHTDYDETLNDKRARVYWPKGWYTGGGPFPIVFIMPGVGLNHAGYRYLAEGRLCKGESAEDVWHRTDAAGLADAGFIVVAIYGVPLAIPNIDVGDTAFLWRAERVVAHVRRWREFNVGTEPLPTALMELLGEDAVKGRVDFSRVGLIGHSRGGQAVRMAFNDLKLAAPEVVIRGIFELAPSDYNETTSDRCKGLPGCLQSDLAPVEAYGTAWNVLLPLCDDDVFDLQGIKPFDRMLAGGSQDDPWSPKPKSAIAVWRGSHALFDETKTVAEGARICVGAEHTAVLDKRGHLEVGLKTVVPFFEEWLNPVPAPTGPFGPFTGLRSGLANVTRVDLSYIASPHAAFSTRFDDFTSPDRDKNDAVGQEIRSARVNVWRAEKACPAEFKPTDGPCNEHWRDQTAAVIRWNHLEPQQYNPAPYYLVGGPAVTVGEYEYLEFRVTRIEDPLNGPQVPTSFHVVLAYSDGTESGRAVSLRADLQQELRGPVGGGRYKDPHALLQTVRIPVDAFLTPGEIWQSQPTVNGVKLVFDETGTGAIYLANVRFSRR